MKYLKWISTYRKPSREALATEEIVQLLKDVIMKDCENIIIIINNIGGMLDKIVEHCLLQM